MKYYGTEEERLYLNMLLGSGKMDERIYLRELRVWTECWVQRVADEAAAAAVRARDSKKLDSIRRHIV